MAAPVPVAILLVEDDPLDGELCLRELKKHMRLANRIVWVKDGAEALEALFGEGRHAGEMLPSPRLVLLDLKLPRLPGLEVLARMRQDERTKDTPVLVLTGAAEAPGASEAMKLGARGVISKPLTPEALVRAVAAQGFSWLAVKEADDAAEAAPKG